MKFPYVQFQGKLLPIVPIRFRLKNGDWVVCKGDDKGRDKEG